MCGISLLIRLDEKSRVDHIERMTRCVRHRGPDDEGYVFFSQVQGTYGSFCVGGDETPESVLDAGLPYTPPQSRHTVPEHPDIAMGHRRLSIIDLSPAGHQPMCYGDSRYWIVYNGEIYNYEILRTELEQLGHTFLSQTDTEVILAAYVQWGKECLLKFNGMWAFTIFDSVAGKVFAARDRFGIKPLYYWHSPEGLLAFASEIKQFTVLPGWEARIHGQRAYEFLNYGLSDHTDETMFQGVRQVKGGWAVEASIEELQSGVPVYPWYTLNPNRFRGSYQEACTAFSELFRESVQLRLRADVPVGSCLSGGLDSSSIVCMVNEILKETGDPVLQQAFSARSEDPSLDEFPYIEEVVKSRNIKSHSILPRFDDLFTSLDDLVWHNDEPFSSTSIFAQSSVFHLASQAHIKVMLDGQGADEILAGYHYLFKMYLAELLKQWKFIHFFKEVGEFRKVHGYDPKKDISGLIYYILPDFLRKLGMRHHASFILPPWLNRERIAFDPGYPIPSSGTRKNLMHQQSLVLVLVKSLPALLHYEDRDSMAHSVESRVPFLDYRLVELVLSLPTEFKIKNAITKRVLRDALSPIIPEKIVRRMDKIGFATAEEKWLRENPDVFRKALSDAVSASDGILNENALVYFDRVINGEEPFSELIWRWICFGTWMRRFGVGI